MTHYRPTLLLLSIVVSALPMAALAQNVEQDMGLERGSFESVELKTTGVTVTDTSNDIAYFDQTGQGRKQPWVADIAKVEMKPGADAWDITFTLAGTLANEPNGPVNLVLYANRPTVGQPDTGGIRAGSDFAAMILFGTKSKWHAEAWMYDDKTNTWSDQPTSIVTARNGSLLVMHVPFSLLPKEEGTTVRFSSLASDNTGEMAVDIAPGTYLPAVRANQPEATAPTNAQPSSSSGGGSVVLIVLIVALAGSVFMAMRRKS